MNWVDFYNVNYCEGNNTKKTNNAGEQGRKDPAIKPGA